MKTLSRRSELVETKEAGALLASPSSGTEIIDILTLAADLLNKNQNKGKSNYIFLLKVKYKVCFYVWQE